MDLNVIVDIATLRNMDCWDNFWAQVIAGTETCATISLTEPELQTLRRQIAPEAVCGVAANVGPESCPQSVSA